MHVVDILDAGDIAHDIVRDRIAVDMRRRGFEQDQPGSAHELPGAAEEQQADQHGEQRVGLRPAGEEDDERRQDRRGRAEQVAEHVQDGAAQVERACRTPCRIAKTTTFTTRPSAAMTSIGPPSTGSGAVSRPTASTPIHSAMPKTVSPFV